MGFDVLDQGLRIGYGKQESFSFTELGTLGAIVLFGLPALTVLAPGMILPLGATLGMGGVDDALGKGMPLLAGFRGLLTVFTPKIAEKLMRLPAAPGKVAIPKLNQGSDKAMFREAFAYFRASKGKTAAERAELWNGMAKQIEARHAPAWTATPARGTDGSYIFIGGASNEGLVIAPNGAAYRIGPGAIKVDLKTGDITVDYTKLTGPF